MKTIVIFTCMVVIGAVVYWLVFSQEKGEVDTASINNYEECAKAEGSKLLFTYPEQCVTVDGKTFVNPEQKVE